MIPLVPETPQPKDRVLTVCQPYAELIARGEKPIENRDWRTPYRGPLWIHAGKSQGWLSEGDEARYGPLVYGAIVARVTLYDCVRLKELPGALRASEHANGPWCWLLSDVQRLVVPFPARGALGIWDVPS